MLDPQTKKEVETLIDKALTRSFNKRIGDTPTDDLQLVNRRYLNLNGTVSKRPSNARTGQQFFATDLNKPIFFNGTNWRDATSSVVAAAL